MILYKTSIERPGGGNLDFITKSLWDQYSTIMWAQESVNDRRHSVIYECIKFMKNNEPTMLHTIHFLNQ